MSNKSMATESPEFSFLYGNILQVDGKFLNTKETSPEVFKETISQLGKQAIINVIENVYQKILAQQKNQADVQRGSVWLINLAKSKKEALSEEAMGREDLPKSSYSDYYRKITDIAEAYHPYWQVVEDLGLIPSALESTNLDGVCLLARDMPLDDTEK